MRPKVSPPNQRRRLHALARRCPGSRHGCGHLCCPPLLLSALISAHLLRHSHDRTSPSLHRLALFSSPLLLFSSRGLLLSAAFLAATGCSFDWWLPRPWPSRLSRCRSSRSLRSSLHCRSSLPSLPRFCMLRLLSHVRCNRVQSMSWSDDAKNDVPCVVCIVSHVREERFVLSDSSQSGSLFRFWFGLVASATIRISDPRSVLGGYAPRCARLICGSGCARRSTQAYTV